MAATATDALYLDLLKKCLTRSLFDESFDRIPWNGKTLFKRVRSSAYYGLNAVLGRWKLAVVHSARPTGETMISRQALDHLQGCIERVVIEGVPGDLIETGVWRGGVGILMRAVLAVLGDEGRRVWLADSFEGLPKPNPGQYPADEKSSFWKQSLGVSVDEVKRNFLRYGLLDERVRFLPGFFSDTMPDNQLAPLSILRLDGDMYESTIVVLEHLYPKLSQGGYVIIDDYGCVPACKQATEDYRRAKGITEPIETIDWTGVCWRKAAS